MKGSCNALKDLSNKLCITNKTEDLNIHVFNMITKHISCECTCNVDSCKCNSNQKFNRTSCIRKNYIWNPATCSCENVEYSAGTIDNSVIK